jgi:hypothetical protein
MPLKIAPQKTCAAKTNLLKHCGIGPQRLPCAFHCQPDAQRCRTIQDDDI